jgi:hypothetical protein
VISSNQSPESLVKRLRALADKRQKEAAREGRLLAQGLLGAADGYRALADALERQPSLSWLQPKSPNPASKAVPASREAAARSSENGGDASLVPETSPGRDG